MSPLARMKPGKIMPRLVEARLQEGLGDSPVVLIHGPRQCGKTTLAQRVGRKLGYAYFSLDDDVSCAAAEADPVGFVAELPERVVLDEVQRVPSLFTALKATHLCPPVPQWDHLTFFPDGMPLGKDPGRRFINYERE